jgi:hypothetical protein
MLSRYTLGGIVPSGERTAASSCRPPAQSASLRGGMSLKRTAVYPDSMRHFGKRRLTSQRRVVGWRRSDGGSDGRRVFTAAFMQDQLTRVARQELTLAKLAQELVASPSVVRRWHRLSTKGNAAAVGVLWFLVPATIDDGRRSPRGPRSARRSAQPRAPRHGPPSSRPFEAGG